MSNVNSIKRNSRHSNIELLRIISILLIISFHYVYKSHYVFETLNFNSFIVKMFYLFGELGVNLFFLITGYFMVDGKFNIKKLMKLILEVEFYHWLIILIFSFCCGGGNFLNNKKNIIISFFPIILRTYWFVSVYILVYIFSPYLNIVINNLNKKEYKRLLIILLIIFSVIPTIFGFLYNNSERILYFSRFIWAIVIYFVGAYIKRYDVKFFRKTSNLLMSAFGSFLLMLVAIVVINSFKNIFAKIGTTEVAYFWTPNSILMVILSVSIFALFLKLKIKSNRIINRLASTTLAIYMLHDGCLKNYIWTEIFDSNKHLHSKYSIFYILGATIIIFIVGSVIDLSRQWIENRCEKLFRDK